MNSAFKNIADTNTAFGNLEKCCIGITNYEKLYNQAVNLYDELDELRDDGFALLIKDKNSAKGREEVVDAIGDLIVFLYGIPHFLGANYVESINLASKEVYNDYQTFKMNIRKHNEEDAFFTNVYNDIKVLIDTLVSGIQNKTDYHTVLADTQRIDTYLFALCEFYGINIKLSIDRITQSNMSKLCKDQDEAEATLKFYRDKGVDVYAKDSPLLQEDGSPYIVVYSSKEQTVGGKVYRAHKFLKCVNWFEPERSDL